MTGTELINKIRSIYKKENREVIEDKKRMLEDLDNGITFMFDASENDIMMLDNYKEEYNDNTYNALCGSVEGKQKAIVNGKKSSLHLCLDERRDVSKNPISAYFLGEPCCISAHDSAQDLHEMESYKRGTRINDDDEVGLIIFESENRNIIEIKGRIINSQLVLD